MSPHATIDIETLSTKPGCIVTEIAYVSFCPKTFRPITQLSLIISPADCYQFGLRADADTLAWREEQPHATPEDHIEAYGIPLASALIILMNVINAEKPAELFCKGTNFDFPILEHCYQLYGQKAPWEYYQLSDIRTLWKQFFPGIKSPKGNHTALNDCHTQISILKTIAAELP